MRKMLTTILFLTLLGLGAPGWAAKVDINRADAAALSENLHGIGPVKARAIVDYRRKHGPFRKIDDLLNVPGIGEATLQKNRRDLSLSGGLTRASGKAAQSSSVGAKQRRGAATTSSVTAKTEKKKLKSFDRKGKKKTKAKKNAKSTTASRGEKTNEPKKKSSKNKKMKKKGKKGKKEKSAK